jgi:hypothetical protein
MGIMSNSPRTGLSNALVIGSISPLMLLLLAAKKSRMRHHIGSGARISLAYGLHSHITKIPAALGMLAIIWAGWAEPTRKR